MALYSIVQSVTSGSLRLPFMVQPDPSKIQALQDLPAPNLQTKLQSFLGLINYLQSFIPGLSAKTSFLLKQLSQLDWIPSTDGAFQCLKAWICQTLLKVTLAYYDRTNPVVIQTDASKFRPGTALLQGGQPIAFTSKILTDIGSCYVNIESVFQYALVWRNSTPVSMEGMFSLRMTTVLEMIQHKPIHAAPPRLQQMLLCMQKYDYTIVYKPGKDMVLSDCLSHFPSNSNYLPIPLAHNIQHVQLSTSELDVIQGSVERDLVYSTVYHLTLRRWPD